jgi:hypothetical protein
MRVRKPIAIDMVNRIKGTPSQVLADRCPDRLPVFPNTPCTNLGCDFRISQADYMNCTFVASEAGGAHTLEAIGEMLEITREGVRQIEVRALRKVRAALGGDTNDNHTTVQKQNMAAGEGDEPSCGQVLELEDAADRVPAHDDRGLVQRGGRA